MRQFVFATLPLMAAACSASGLGNARTAEGRTVSAPLATATAQLTAADGASRGSATLSEGADGLTVTVRAEGLAAGEHGWHVHGVGRCEAPSFASAGAHWNPTAKQHGRDNPQGAHSGDMPNLSAGADGSATASYTIAGQTLANLLDADGAALLIHAKADDYKTDPSGASGDRIACGVITRN